MAFAADFQDVVDSLPEDWTDIELDLRIVDESRYVEAALYLATCNARPYSHHDWHWRLLVAHRFGHAAAAPTVHGTLGLLDDADKRTAGSLTNDPFVKDDLGLRMSAGLSVFWKSPLGPIRIDLAAPILKERYDKTQVFSFSTQTRF